MGFTPDPLGAWYLAWIALIPLWLLLFSEPPEKTRFSLRSLKRNGSIALAWGCGYHGLALFWITGIHPMTWMGVPWLASLAIALFCWLFITFWGALLVIAWASGMTLLEKVKFRRETSLIDALVRVLVGVALWCVLETLWSQGSLWWTSLSYTQSPHNLPILQLGKLSGFSTITAAIVAVNGLLAESIIAVVKTQKRDRLFLFVLPLSVYACSYLGGSYLYHLPLDRADGSAIRVGIIQGNIPNEIKLYSQGWDRAIEGYTEGYKILSDRGVDIILTPETALPFFWDDLVANSSFYRAIAEKHVPAWVGAFAREGKSFTNSLFTVTGEGKVVSRYDKVKLVPLGEYIPFENILGGLIDRLSPLDAHLVAGTSEQHLNTPFGSAIVGICYESAFSEHFRRQAARGGEFMITASNNAHYSKVMPAQHHAQDVMRAIETDRWAARATNTGYSAIVDPRGRTLWISQINTYELHSGTIYRRQTKTLYVRWGDWLTVVLAILGTSSWYLRYR